MVGDLDGSSPLLLGQADPPQPLHQAAHICLRVRSDPCCNAWRCSGLPFVPAGGTILSEWLAITWDWVMRGGDPGEEDRTLPTAWAWEGTWGRSCGCARLAHGCGCSWLWVWGWVTLWTCWVHDWLGCVAQSNPGGGSAGATTLEEGAGQTRRQVINREQIIETIAKKAA